ncbi:hypothetical protein [Necropsobacter massiliensis]|uniref:hypothetical protein n=1 Tax=Necropsobacter massiliensis TaxID=1400001 RepID=UPI000AC85C5A|nr:hypothetical protein [Necropsobacter massiliensis]
MLAIVIIIAAIIAVNCDKIITGGLLTLAVVCLHNLAGLGLGLVVGKLLRLNYAKTTALAIEVGMQNSELAVTLATMNFAANHSRHLLRKGGGVRYSLIITSKITALFTAIWLIPFLDACPIFYCDCRDFFDLDRKSR